MAALATASAYAQSTSSPNVAYDAISGTEYITDDPVAINNYLVMKDTEIIHMNPDSAQEMKDAVKRLQAIFYDDQFRNSQDPKSPYFMLLSRNGKLAMGVGGDVRVIGSYDFDGSQEGSGFAPYNIPIPKDISSNSLFQISPNRTGVFFTILGHNDRFGDFQVYVHGKFNGANNTFKLDKAYATIGDWLFGLAPTTFSDPIAQPATVETDGPNSEVDDKRVLLRYMHKLSQKFTIAASIENADNDVPTSASYRPHTSTIPDVAAFLQFASGKQHIRVTGIVRNMRYTDLVSMTNHNVTGWGATFNVKLSPVNPLTIYGSFNAGRGIGSMVNDLSLGDNDLLGYTDDPGKMYAPASFGWYGALEYYFSHKVFSTLIFSQERMLLKKDTAYSGDGYRYGLYGTANVFWNIVPRLQVGAEFNIGKRCDQNGAHRLGYRTSIMAQYSF